MVYSKLIQLLKNLESTEPNFNTTVDDSVNYILNELLKIQDDPGDAQLRITRLSNTLQVIAVLGWKSIDSLNFSSFYSNISSKIDASTSTSESRKLFDFSESYNHCELPNESKKMMHVELLSKSNHSKLLKELKERNVVMDNHSKLLKELKEQNVESQSQSHSQDLVPGVRDVYLFDKNDYQKSDDFNKASVLFTKPIEHNIREDYDNNSFFSNSWWK